MSEGDGQVVPFRRPQKAAPARSGDPQTSGRGRRTAAEQNAEGARRYLSAALDQRASRLIASGRAVPARITMALDARGLWGPEVDEACGVAEPTVDLWECGLVMPTLAQMQALAELTGYPLWTFYEPMPAGPYPPGPVFICGRGRGGSGCQVVNPHWVDARGVLHYEGVPRQPPAGWRGLVP